MTLPRTAVMSRLTNAVATFEFKSLSHHFESSLDKPARTLRTSARKASYSSALFWRLVQSCKGVSGIVTHHCREEGVRVVTGVYRITLF
jgi:hypothetical protein